MIGARRDILVRMRENYSWETFKRLAREYKDFPIYNAPTGLIFNFSKELPTLMLGYLYSPIIVGFYAMANRLTQMPINLAAVSIRRVFLQRLKEIRDRGGRLGNAYLKSTAALALIGIVPFGLLWFFGEKLLSILLGQRWEMAGQYVKILAPWLYLVWVTIPVNPIIVVLRKQRLWFRMHIGVMVTRLVVFVLAYLLAATPVWALSAFVVVSTIGQIAILIIVYCMARDSDAGVAANVDP